MLLTHSAKPKALSTARRHLSSRRPKIVGLFNGRISTVVKQTRSISAAELELTLMNYQNTYNHHIPQRALKQLSRVEALQN